MVQSRIEVPISLSVTGGRTAPVVVTAPVSSGSGGISAQQPVPAVTVTQQPTIASTQAVHTQAPVVVVETTMPAPIPQPPTGMGFLAAMVACGLVVLFAAVIVFDTKRGGKKP
jgi:hypothetical protein